MRAHAGLTVLAAALVLRCSAFDAGNPSSGSNVDAGNVDPGRPDHADAGPDAVGAPVDGGSDAPDPQTCAFCDDFEAKELQPRWMPLGDFVLDSALARAPSRQSLRISSSGTDKDQIVGHIPNDGKGTWTTYVQYDLEDLGALSAPVGLLSVSWGDVFDVDQPFGLAELVLKSGGLGLVTGRRGTTNDSAGVYDKIATKTWLKIVVRFDLHKGDVNVRVDDKDALFVSGYDFMTPMTLTGGMDLRLGRSQGGPALTVWYDDTSFAE